MSSPSSNDQRRLKRWQLILYLRVFNHEDGQLLGHVIDINTQGLRLISDTPLALDTDYRLWLEVPREDGGHERVDLIAHSRWRSLDVNPDFFDTGFQLVEPSERIIKRIQAIIEDLQF